MPRWVGVLLTFHFVTLAWVFFRAPNLGRAAYVITAVSAGHWAGASQYLSMHVFEILLMVVFFALHRFDDNRRVRIIAARSAARDFMAGLAGAVGTGDNGQSGKLGEVHLLRFLKS